MSSLRNNEIITKKLAIFGPEEARRRRRSKCLQQLCCSSNSSNTCCPGVPFLANCRHFYEDRSDSSPLHALFIGSLSCELLAHEAAQRTPIPNTYWNTAVNSSRTSTFHRRAEKLPERRGDADSTSLPRSVGAVLPAK